MKSMSNLQLQDIIGMWECKVYRMFVTNKTITLYKKTKEKTSIDENIIWKHITDENDKTNYNTIQLSANIFIRQLFDDNEDSMLIRYKDEEDIYIHIDLVKQFKYLQNKINPSRCVALRWYSPWNYVAMIEMYDFKIIRILKGSIDKERKEINSFYYEESLNSDKWIEKEFETFFPSYRQREILERFIQEFKDI